MRSVGASLTRRAVLVGRSALAWRPTWRWALGVLRAFVTSFLALVVALWLLPGTQITAGTRSVAGLAVAVLVVGALLRPFLTLLTVLTGVVGLLVAGLLAQALVLGLALAAVPTVEPFSFWEIVVASWAAAVAAAVLNWLFDASSDEVFLGQVLGRAVGTAQRHPVSGPGVLVVQLDGVSEPLLRQAMTAGAMPNLSRWLRSGSHRLRGWHTGVPATTPAGQAVLLHGDATRVPGFRWYDKDLGRALVCSRPGDLAEVEATLSDGRGLLADDGVSVSNLFSGDAPTKVLTMSDARLPSRQRGAAAYMGSRTGFVRSVVLFFGQVVTEWYQGRRQRRRDVVPRVRRSGAFVFLRGLTTVILRDLNVAVVSDQLARGAPVVYVDFVDYDEVAHHAGPSRPESLRTLESLDRILGFFGVVGAEVGRDYELVVLSDHGQVQGSTFEQLAGRSLDDVVDGLVRTARPAGHDRHEGETWAPAHLLTGGGPIGGRAIGRAARSAAAGSHVAASAPPGAATGTFGADAAEGTVLVSSSGSLSHLYLVDEPGRATRERIDELHPGLVVGLASEPYVGCVVTRRADGGVVVDGPSGWRVLTPAGEVDGRGDDPLAAYGARAAADLLDLDGKAHVGDLVLMGRFDRDLGEVAAFEELVGSHGGLGGWQSRALLIHPAAWEVPPDLDGRAVHRVMVDRLDALGLRRTPAGVRSEAPEPLPVAEVR